MNHVSFDEFMEACDAIMVSTFGVGVEDIADWTWRDAYEDGAEPEDAVLNAIAYDGTW